MSTVTVPITSALLEAVEIARGNAYKAKEMGSHHTLNALHSALFAAVAYTKSEAPGGATATIDVGTAALVCRYGDYRRTERS